MPIIGKVGRRSFKVRWLNFAIHLILIIGGITMIYPFLIMMSASFKSRVDSKYLDIIPKYFHDDEMLYKKYIESRFNEEAAVFTAQYKSRYFSVDYLKFPVDPDKQFNSDWNEFISKKADSYDEFDYSVSEQFSRGVYAKNERAFRKKMSAEVDGDLSELNRKYGISAPTWEDVREESKDILSRKFTSGMTGMMIPYSSFRKELDLRHKAWMSLDGHFISNELLPAFKGKLELLNEALGTTYPSWDNITLARRLPQDSLRSHWTHYVKKILNVHHISLDSAGTESYREFLKEKYENIELLNETWKSSFAGFDGVSQDKAYSSGAPLLDYIFFIENIADPAQLYISSAEFDFRDHLKAKYPDIVRINDIYSKRIKSFDDIKLSASIPENNLVMKRDWVEFVRSADISSVHLSPASQFDYIEFLKTKFGGNGLLDIESINRTFGTDYDKEINIYPSTVLPKEAKHAELWLEFIKHHADPKYFLIGLEQSPNWIRFLKNKYGSIDTLNSAYGYIYTDHDKIDIDFQTLDYFIFKEYKKEIFREHLIRNYAMVLDEMFNNGRAIMNTLWYCLLAILTALIVNPLAAYTMSRFKLRSNYRIILILMLTMAFPPMVMGIPNFLILKNLNLLNTFWALILPAAADGYFIFLLKGFFDSLPKELFESATVDGAGEFTIFTRIAMSLSKPIMAVIALGAFNAAYRNFMFAFIVCQDQSMWTLMVHIYQLSQRASSGVGYAALVIAAIPTFAVFIFFQNIIIKGIVVPTEK
jgi:ABC-type glycerol-3-phosphate transport system permease component